MNIKQKYGQTALIAGASEGLGMAYCEALAAQGMDLVMIARRQDYLDKAAAIIRSKYKVIVTTIACDLSSPSALKNIQDQLGETQIDLLVYNAAMSQIGPFLNEPVQTHLDIATTNMLSPMQLVHHFGGAMVQRGRGAVILMASIAGFQGAGFLATYASTKSFNRTLAESLWYEWKDRGVDVIGCCAGATSTPNYLNTKPKPISMFAPKVQSPEEVVAECLDQLGEVPSFVTGAGNKLATFFMKMMSRKASVNIMGDTAVKMYDIKY